MNRAKTIGFILFFIGGFIINLATHHWYTSIAVALMIVGFTVIDDSNKEDK